MKFQDYAPNIVLIIGVISITFYFFYKIRQSNADGFIDITSAISIAKESQKDKPPSNEEMANYYKMLLLYIKSDFSKGLLYVYDLNKRIYGKADRVPEEFDPRKILDDYKNPVTGF
jgi:hypothetical protein